ncbi:hypothetical protein DL765_002715 [Monosporascus sp. GIB2]|nr:hypothetical protein DL765_002715 [Monosporascus sp. GIB2]
MSTYVIAGASRGLGFEMLRQLSSNSKNTVIGLARDPSSAKEKVSAELSDRSNVHILAGDLTNYDSLKTAADETSAIAGGSLDYLIANAAIMTPVDEFSPIGEISPKDAADALNKTIGTNVIGNIYLINVFLPLILKGNTKKIITISSGMADIDFINQFDIQIAALYSASKAASNVITAKYSAQYKKQGVLFIMSPEQVEGLQGMFAGFQRYAPNFKGPVPREQAVQDVIKVWENASIEKGDGGAFVSHQGNKKWL